MEQWLEILTYLAFAALYFVSQFLINRAKPKGQGQNGDRPEVDEKAARESRQRPVQTEAGDYSYEEEAQSGESRSEKPYRRPEVSSPDPEPKKDRPGSPFETWWEEMQKEWNPYDDDQEQEYTRPQETNYRKEQKAEDVRSEEGQNRGYDWNKPKDTVKKKLSSQDYTSPEQPKMFDRNRFASYNKETKNYRAAKYARMLKNKDSFKDVIILNELLNRKHF